MCRLEINIPEEFERDYTNDKFKDFFSRVLCDIENGVLCGNYEKEIAEMFIEAFDESKPAYDMEKVEEQLDEYITKIVGRKSALYQTIMGIVRKGGKDDAN